MSCSDERRGSRFNRVSRPNGRGRAGVTAVEKAAVEGLCASGSSEPGVATGVTVACVARAMSPLGLLNLPRSCELCGRPMLAGGDHNCDDDSHQLTAPY